MIQPKGYLKLWRELMIKPIWLNSTPEQKTILITLLAMANFKEKQWEWEGKKFTVKPGQFITSANSIIENCGVGVTRQNVRTALARFEKLEFLTMQSTKTGMLITIENWALYQGDDCTANQDTNQDLTNTQPTANQQLTTREECKESKKDKKDIYTQEFEQFYSIYPRPQAKQDTYKNWSKRIKEHSIDYIMQCTEHYLDYYNTLPDNKKEFAYASNNFLGQKAYYKDYERPVLRKIVNNDWRL